MDKRLRVLMQCSGSSLGHGAVQSGLNGVTAKCADECGTPMILVNPESKPEQPLTRKKGRVGLNSFLACSDSRDGEGTHLD
jgi:hypothetical protein